MKLLCPRCEKPLEDHEDGQCPKRLNRRFFLGALGSAFGVAALAKYLPEVEVSRPTPGSLIVAAAPKVHRAATIRLTSNHASAEEIAANVRYVAQLRQVPVVGLFKDEVVHFVDPIKERLI